MSSVTIVESAFQKDLVKFKWYYSQWFVLIVLISILLGDTASNLGGAMDELMRHQPLLRESVMSALIRV